MEREREDIEEVEGEKNKYEREEQGSGNIQKDGRGLIKRIKKIRGRNEMKRWQGVRKRGKKTESSS